MSILNFASNKFFDDDDYALSAVAKSRLVYNEVNPDLFPLNVDMIEVGMETPLHSRPPRCTWSLPIFRECRRIASRSL